MPRTFWLIALGFVVLSVAAYSASIGGGFLWDDDNYVSTNTTLRTPQGLFRIWIEPQASPQYYPVTMTSFWIEWQLWGDSPTGYRVVNVLLHAVNAILIGLILLRLGVPGALLAGALFAVHPVHVESVAWITERKNVLSLCFFLLSLMALLKWCGVRPIATRATPVVQTPAPSINKWYFAGLALFVCAVLSKSVTASLPAAMLLILWWKHGRVSWRVILALLPLFLIGIALGLTTAYVERTHVGATGRDFDLSTLDRIAVAGRAVWFYFSSLLLSTERMFIYPRWQVGTGERWRFVYPLAAMVLVLGLWLSRRRLGRGPLVGALLFGGMLVPALGFVNVYPMKFSFVADHFQYHASIGMIALIASAIALLEKRWRALVIAGMLALCLWRTAAGAAIFRNDLRLWRDTLDKNPDAWLASANLGTHALRKAAAAPSYEKPALLDEAESAFRTVAAQRPHDADPLISLALVAEQSGDLTQAIRLLDQAAALQPELGEPYFHKAKMLAGAGNMDEAISAYQKCLTLTPRHVPARVNLGAIFADQGRTDEAVDLYRSALEIDPDSVFARFNLANTLLKLGQVEEAIIHYEWALKIEPKLTPARQVLQRLRR